MSKWLKFYSCVTATVTEGVGRMRPDTHLSRQNAAGKKEITTVLLLLVKFCRKYENQRYMKKRWPLKNKGSALFGSKSFLLIEEKNQGFMLLDI